MDLMTIVELAKSAWVIWLTLVFLGIVFWVFRPSNKKRFEDDANIIFRDDDPDEK